MARARLYGAITFVQRFNSALELSLHFHMLVPDGVFVAGGARVDERSRFVELPGPRDEEVVALLAELAKRVTRMLHAHGRMLDDACDEEPEPQLLFAGQPAPTSSGPQQDEKLPARCAREGAEVGGHIATVTHQDGRMGTKLARIMEKSRNTHESDGLFIRTTRQSSAKMSARTVARGR